MKTTIKLLTLAVMLSACAPKNLSPALPKGEAELPKSWQELSVAAVPADGKRADELSWREYFQDGRLQKLIAEALEHNNNLRSYVLDTRIAELNYNISEINRSPTVNGGGSIGHQGRTKSGSHSQNSFAANLTGSYDLDLWGGKAAESEQALNQFLATKEGQDSAKLSLIKNVASTYYQIRILAAQIDLAKIILDLQQQKLHLAQLQSNAGVITNIDLRQFEEAVDQAKIAVIDAEGNQQKAFNALALLVGRPLSAIELPPANPNRNAFGALQVPTVASEALLHRPDIRVAELQLKAANANIGVARANLYPSISLGGGLNLSSDKLKDFFSNGLGYSVNSNIGALIFNRDKLHNAVKISELQQEKALENYKKTVKAAFYEVADLLKERETLQEKYKTQLAVGKTVADRLRLENLRFQAGVSTASDLLNAQQAANNSDSSMLNIELQLLTNQINLYTALGGGRLDDNGLPDVNGKGESKAKAENKGKKKARAAKKHNGAAAEQGASSAQPPAAAAGQLTEGSPADAPTAADSAAAAPAGTPEAAPQALEPHHSKRQLKAKQGQR